MIIRNGLSNSIHLDPVKPEDFIIEAPSADAVEARIIKLIPGMVYTKEESEEMVPSNGFIEGDVERDIAKMAVFYRPCGRDPRSRQKIHGAVEGTDTEATQCFCHNSLPMIHTTFL